MFVDLDLPLNASSLLSASAELLVKVIVDTNCLRHAYSFIIYTWDVHYLRMG